MAGDPDGRSPTGGAAAGQQGGPEGKGHIYYGKISQLSSSSAAAVCEEGPPQGGEGAAVSPAGSVSPSPPKGESPTASGAAETDAADPAVKRHEERLKAFQTQQVASSFKTVAPTIDADVRDALRRMEEPITLFGEGPFERRARLKALLASGRTIPPPQASVPRPQQPLPVPAARVIAVKKQQTKTEEEEPAAAAEKELQEIEGTFYTEGQPSLLNFRKMCAAASGVAAQKRLRREAVYRHHAKQLQQEKSLSCLPSTSPILDMHFFNKFMQMRMGLAASIVGDERPLTCCRFAPSSAIAKAVVAAASREDETQQQTSSNDAQASTAAAATAGGGKDAATEALQTLLATASWGENVKIWTPSEGRLLLQLKQHQTRVHSLAWRPLVDEQTLILASGSADATVCLWNIGQAAKADSLTAVPSNKLLIGRLTGHEERVNRVVFHPTGRCLGTTSHDETWRLWDLETRQEILLQEGHSAAVYALCFHPDGSLAVTSDLTGLVKVTDVRVGRGVLDIAAHVKQVIALSVHPVCANWMVTGGDDNCVKLWDLRKVGSTSAAAQAAAADQGTTAASCLSQPLLTIPAHTKMVTECIFEPQRGRCLYTSGFDGLVKVWSCTDFSLQKSLPAHDGKVMSIDVFDCSSTLGSKPLLKEEDKRECMKNGEGEEELDSSCRGGGDTVASVGFDRTWKLWHCNGSYNRAETEALLLEKITEESKEANAAAQKASGNAA
ncbi:hypothetical protein Emag_003797 [Eimeria magna]